MAIRTRKRLVELNGEYGGWLEIDMVKLKRVAKEFKVWLLSIDPNNDQFSFLRKVLPLVESALDGTMELPFRGSNPHNWEIREGELDWYLAQSSEFFNTIRGALYEPPEVVMKDGRYFAWAAFELPEDDAP